VHKFAISQRVNILDRQGNVIRKGTILRHDGVDGSNPAYSVCVDGQEIDRVLWENFLASATDPDCDCCNGTGFGLFQLPNFPKTYAYLDIEKCGNCDVFESDEDAAQVANALGMNVKLIDRTTGEQCRQINENTIFAVSVEEAESCPFFKK